MDHKSLASLARLVTSLVAAIYILFYSGGAQAQLNVSQFLANPQVATIKNLPLTDVKTLSQIGDLITVLNNRLKSATGVERTTIQAQLDAIGAGLASAISSNDTLLTSIINTAKDLNATLLSLNVQLQAAPDGQKAAVQAQIDAIQDQLKAIGTDLAQAALSDPVVGGQIQTALAGPGVPNLLLTTYAALTGNVVTASNAGGGGGGGIGGAIGGFSGSSGGGGGGGNSQGGGGGGNSQGGGGLTGGGGGGGGGNSQGQNNNSQGQVSNH